MSKDALKSLSIEHLRGSVVPFKLPFEKDKNLTLIYGENGTGKTTICDAFEFIGKGKIGSLEKRGLGRTNRYWTSIGKKVTDVAVTLETDITTCRATINGADVVLNPTANKPKVEVLRRSQILELIEARPADRYAAISKFIDVSGAEASENSLRELIRTIERGREVAVARVQENLDSIEQFWLESGAPAPSAVEWAEAEVEKDSSTLEAELEAISGLVEIYNRLKITPDNLKKLNLEVVEAQTSHEASQATLNECLKTVAADAVETVGLLQAAKEFFVKNANPDTCPLCYSGENAEGLSLRVSERLTTFSALQDAQTALRKSNVLLEAARTKCETLIRNVKTDSEAFSTCLGSYAWPSDVTLPLSPFPDNPAEWENWVVANNQLYEGWKKAEASRQGTKQFISTLKRALKTYSQNVKEQKEIDALLPRLKKALQIAEDERRQFTDVLLSQISQEVGRLYEIVHPGEGLNKISLELDPARRGSLEIGASFCGHDAPPQAYFSDSHLDTLGICVFLALAALEPPEETILVLDDVLASVDEPHVERLIEMLYLEMGKFRHGVITTHYRPWKQKFRWGWLKNGQCQFVELTKWTASNGLVLTRSIPDIQSLRELLAGNPPDPQLVCAKAGFILEAALDFLTQHYECSVPRRPNSLFTIGDLLPAVGKKLRQALRIEVLQGFDEKGTPIYTAVELAPILDELTRIAQARNVFGCHFNVLSFEMLEGDALGFGQTVLQLMDVLTDGNAGWPRNGKSGSYWATTGETRRLHPYKRPE